MLFGDKKDNRDASSKESVPLLPLRELIVFPHEVCAILVGRGKSIKALEVAEQHKRPILLAAQKDPRVSDPGPDDIYAVDVAFNLEVGENFARKAGFIAPVAHRRRRAYAGFSPPLEC